MKLCSICLEDLINETKTISCNHVFHISCIDAWLEKNETCPVCSAQLPKNVIFSTNLKNLATQQDESVYRDDLLKFDEVRDGSFQENQSINLICFKFSNQRREKVEKCFQETNKNCGFEMSVCSICLEDLTEETKIVACNHIFHIVCIDVWLENSPTCPVCRSRLREDSFSHNEFFEWGEILNESNYENPPREIENFSQQNLPSEISSFSDYEKFLEWWNETFDGFNSEESMQIEETLPSFEPVQQNLTDEPFFEKF